MTREKMQMTAFEIISYAGDAFASFYEAVEEARKGNFERASALLKEGEDRINQAHNAQTELLSAEANEENMDFSLILVHSQDHLMTTIMYERIAKQMIEVLQDIQKN